MGDCGDLFRRAKPPGIETEDVRVLQGIDPKIISRGSGIQAFDAKVIEHLRRRMNDDLESIAIATGPLHAIEQQAGGVRIGCGREISVVTKRNDASLLPATGRNDRAASIPALGPGHHGEGGRAKSANCAGHSRSDDLRNACEEGVAICGSLGSFAEGRYSE